MVVLFASERQTLQRLRNFLPATGEIRATTDWSSFEQLRGLRRCSVVAIEKLPTDPAFPKLIAFTEKHPLYPVILVTRWDPENARCLKDVSVEDVVWWREVEQLLSDSLQRVCGAGYVRQLAERFEAAEHLPSKLRVALVLMCSDEGPILTVKKLAKRTGCSRATLSRRWREVEEHPSPLRLEDMLHWILLLRAVDHRQSGASWGDAASRLGVEPRFLRRHAKQLTGDPIPELASEARRVMQRFEREIGRKLLRPAE